MNEEEILNSASVSDKAVGFFNDIFGMGWQDIIEGRSPAGGAGSVIFELFYAFNAVTLAAVTVLMFYIVSAGVVGTAHEGEALGKRYSTLWTPLRSVLAISLLMPLPWVKISLLQALILKFVFFSIGGASYLAGHTVDFMARQGGGMTAPKTSMPYAEGLGEEILKNLVVQEYYREREGGDYGDGMYDVSFASVKGFIFAAPAEGLRPYMAKFKVSCLGKSENLCISEMNAGVQLANDLRPIAQAIVSQWSGGADIKLDENYGQMYRSALQNYVGASQQAAADALSEMGSNKNLDDFAQSVENNGWTWLGAYYWKIAKFNEEAQQQAQTKLVVSTAADESALAHYAGPEIEPVLVRYRDFVDKIAAGRVQQRLIATTASDTAGAGALVGSFWSDALGSSFGEETAMSGASKVLADTIAKGDPIDNLQKLGHQLINTASTMTLVSTGISAGVKAVSLFTGGSPLSSSVARSAISIPEKIIEKAMAIIMPIVMALMISGIALAYYLPALPFILWISGIVGWLVLTMELLVAAPIWAAMHAIPEGEGMAGQHGRQGYMLFLGILMRPSLHVIGFFLSFMIISVVGHFIGESYLDFTTATGQDEAPFGPVAQIVAWLATILLGAAITVIATHKTFSLITWLPDNILRWAGAGTPSLGEHNDEQRTSHMFVGAIGKSNSAIMAGVNGAMPRGGAAAAPQKSSHDMHSLGDKK